MQRVAKDQGWAWVVLCGTFVAMFLETGVVKALGVVLPVLRQQLVTATWIIGLSIALIPGFGALTCPIGGALSKRLSPRSTVMMFSIFATTGLFTASLASNVYMLMMSTILTGFSLGAEAVMIGELAHYFDDYYEFAMSIAFMGLSLGVIIMPLLTQFLLDLYGWRGTMMMLCAFIFHLVVCGATLTRVSSQQDENSDEGRLVVTETAGNEDKLTVTDADGCHGSKTSFILNFAYYFDLVLFKNINFVSLLLYNLGSGYSFTGWLIYLVPHAMEAGFTLTAASALATYGGIGSLTATILYPVVKTRVGNKHVLYSMTALNVVALLADPFFLISHSYVGLSVSSACFGFGRGMCILSVYTLTKENVEQEHMTNAVIWINVVYSAGSLFSGFLSGWIFDETGSYTASFLILSAISVPCLSLQIVLDIQNCYSDVIKYRKLSANDPNHIE